MLASVKSMALHGLDGYLINVEVDVSGGLPTWEIVGLADTTIKEAKERIRIAIKNSGIDFPSRRIIVNLAPADIRKEGTFFDLPIAIGILITTETVVNNNLEDTVLIGELSLDGKIQPINGVLPMCIEAVKLGIKRVILPKGNSKEACIVEGLEIIPVDTLEQTINFLNGNINIAPEENSEGFIFKNNDYPYDFSEVKRTRKHKTSVRGRSCWTDIIVYLFGSPGCGKTMVARRLPSILPELSFEEALEVTKIHSIAGELKEKGLITQRPFRSPHHTISGISLIGGGRIPKPGEVSLSHHGVLFLDELPEFNKKTLEVLRGPLEDRKVSITRVNASLTYPCNFMLIASMNPCSCGYYGSSEKECTCSDRSIQNYMGKISGPLLDRIDIHIEVSAVKYQKLTKKEKGESSSQIRERVNKARKIQRQRYKNYSIFSNAELTPALIEEYCSLDENCSNVLQQAFQKFGLSARAHSRILKVARTIADLDESKNINITHLAEAIQYRTLDRKYFN